MLYLGIDLHLKQMTISLRNESGDVVLRRQVSTRWPKLAELREQLHVTSPAGENCVAVVEVCGFHDWLVRWLRRDDRCQKRSRSASVLYCCPTPTWTPRNPG